MTLPDALAIIDAAVIRSRTERGADEQTLEALRTIWRHSKDPDLRDAVIRFKDILGWKEWARYQNASAARNRINRLLEGR